MRLRPEQRARGHLGPATCCEGKMPRQAGHPQLQYGEEELKAQRAAQAGMASQRQPGKNPGPLRLGFSLPLRQREPLTPEKFPAEAASFVWGPGSLLQPHTVRSRGFQQWVGLGQRMPLSWANTLLRQGPQQPIGGS